MSYEEIKNMDEEFKRLAHEVRVCADKLNDAIINAVRGGLDIHVEVRELTSVDSDVVRPLVIVQPMKVLRF